MTTNARVNLALWLLLLGCDGLATSTAADPAQADLSAEQELSRSPEDTPREYTPTHQVEPDASTARLVPPDLSTAIGATFPTLLVLDSRPELTVDEQRDWMSRIALVAWPSMREVRSTVSYVPPQSEFGDTGHRFVVSSAEPISGAWYALAVDAVGTPPDPNAFRAPDGRLCSRFRVDSHPVLTDVSVHQVQAGRSTVELAFSERVRPGREAPVVFWFDGRQADCRLLSPSVSVDSIVGDSSARDSMAFQCDFGMPGHLRLVVSADVSTDFGESVFGQRDETPAELAWSPSAGQWDAHVSLREFF